MFGLPEVTVTKVAIVLNCECLSVFIGATAAQMKCYDKKKGAHTHNGILADFEKRLNANQSIVV